VRIAFLIVVCGVLYLSLYPGQFDLSRHLGLTPRFIPIQHLSDWLDLFLNVLFYAPVGFTAVLAWCRRPGWTAILTVTAFGAALSYGIEVAQLYLPRFSNWRDVFCNTAGTFIGAGLASSRLVQRLHLHRTLSSLGQPPVGWWLTACWTLWLAFPLYPRFRWVQLRRAVEHSIEEIQEPAFMVLVAGTHFLGAWVLATVSPVAGLRRWLLPALATAAVFWPMLIIHLRFSPGRLSATIIGFLLAYGLSPVVGRRALAAMTAGWLAFTMFYPFTPAPTPAPFAWIPLAGLTRANMFAEVRSLFGVMLVVSMAVWGLRRAGLSGPATAALVGALVVAGEWYQRYLPGHQGSMSEVGVSALAIGVTGWLMRLSRGR